MEKTTPKDSAILEVSNLTKSFKAGRTGLFKPERTLKAVADVSFSIRRGTTLGLVGESGCGKSTLGRCVLRLLEPTKGKIVYQGNSLTDLSTTEMRKMRRKMQIIFQDPFGSLNPRLTVAQILGEALEVHKLYVSTPTEKQNRLIELLALVGMREDSLTRFPHEFSGGQRQRICIARALAVEPEFLICDEPVSALDVSIQAQILNLLVDLQKKLGLTYLFISHDLRVIRYLCDDVAVMYLGKIVEFSSAKQLFEHPRHPYTTALLSAIPDVSRHEKRQVLSGDVPSPLNIPTGCAFHTRCPKAKQRCSEETPELESLRTSSEESSNKTDNNSPRAACFFPN